MTLTPITLAQLATLSTILFVSACCLTPALADEFGDHSDGYQTHYGHARAVIVRRHSGYELRYHDPLDDLAYVPDHPAYNIEHACSLPPSSMDYTPCGYN